MSARAIVDHEIALVIASYLGLTAADLIGGPRTPRIQQARAEIAFRLLALKIPHAEIAAAIGRSPRAVMPLAKAHVRWTQDRAGELARLTRIRSAASRRGAQNRKLRKAIS